MGRFTAEWLEFHSFVIMSEMTRYYICHLPSYFQTRLPQCGPAFVANTSKEMEKVLLLIRYEIHEGSSRQERIAGINNLGNAVL